MSKHLLPQCPLGSQCPLSGGTLWQMRPFGGKQIHSIQTPQGAPQTTPQQTLRYLLTAFGLDLLLEFKFETEPSHPIESCLFVWPMPPSGSSAHQYFKSQSAFLRPARSDEWRVIGAFHKPKSALVSSSPLTLSSRCLCIRIVIWTTKSDTDAICEQISSCSDLLILSHHQWWFIISSNSYCGRQVMAGICT